VYRSSDGKLTWINQPLFKILKKEDGSSAKRMSSGISIGHYHGLSKVFLIQIPATE
jgi:hypothetical protein